VPLTTALSLLWGLLVFTVFVLFVDCERVLGRVTLMSRGQQRSPRAFSPGFSLAFLGSVPPACMISAEAYGTVGREELPAKLSERCGNFIQ